MTRPHFSSHGRQLQLEIDRNRTLWPTKAAAEGFRTLFHRIARASIAASAIGLVACSSSHQTDDAGGDAGTPDSAVRDGSAPDTSVRDGSVAPDATVGPDVISPPPPRGMTCIGGEWRPTQGINTDASYEYIGIYGAGVFGDAFLIDEDGEQCGAASDADVCLSKLVEDAPPQAHIRTTDRDEVNFITAPTIASFLGEIDTADEALIVAAMDDLDVYCEQENISVIEVPRGFEVWATRVTRDCDPFEVTQYHLLVEKDGTMTVLDSRVVSSEPGLCIGRRPEGLVPAQRCSPVSGNSRNVLGQFFSEITRLEASAVTAFQVLGRELAHHGAPKALVDACYRAADDEARHTEQMGNLAAYFGGAIEAPKIEERPIRGVFAIAKENAVEGCVRETFGALVGVHQSLTAEDEAVRREMCTVAEDETRHSELSWQIAAWIEPRLTDSERERLWAAKAQAIAELRLETSASVDPTLVREAGVPAPERALEMLEQLNSSLWA